MFSVSPSHPLSLFHMSLLSSFLSSFLFPLSFSFTFSVFLSLHLIPHPFLFSLSSSPCTFFRCSPFPFSSLLSLSSLSPLLSLSLLSLLLSSYLSHQSGPSTLPVGLSCGPPTLSWDQSSVSLVATQH